MADVDPKVVQEARKKIAEIAGKLTSEGQPVFSFDNDKYYSKGETFQELDGIRDLKLPAILRKVVKNEAAKKEATDGLTDAEKATRKQAENLLEKAQKSLKANEAIKAEDRKADLDVPMARIIVAADGYRDAGKHEEADKLYSYAIQQAEIIEKEVLAANAKQPEAAKRTPTMTDAIKEYKYYIDLAAGRAKVMEAELRGSPGSVIKDGSQNKDDSQNKEPDVSFNPAGISADVARLVANMDSIVLERDALNLPAKLGAKTKSVA